jgi:protein O-GlcNAc transferase
MLRDIYRQNSDRFKVETDNERRLFAEELRGRIRSGKEGAATSIELARVLETLREYDAAFEVLRDGCRELRSPEIHIEYAEALARSNRADNAIEAAREALIRFPGDLRLQMIEALTLPIIYDNNFQLERYRERFVAGLDAIAATLTLTTPGLRENALAAIYRRDNFYLCYQLKDDRDVQERYARLVARILRACYPDLFSRDEGQSPRRERRIRVGYISPHLHRHSVSKAYAGWILSHDREKFEVFVYHASSGSAEIRDDLQRGADHLRQLPSDFPGVCSMIHRDYLDAVILLDVGMNPLMTLLAAVRLAPVQCVTWGHPVTTGSANMDFFLSSDLMEPADADCQYSERLIRLPGVGVCYPKPLIPRALLDTARSRFGLGDERVVYVCSQLNFKYVPEHDDLFPRIAARVANAQFVFVAASDAVQGVLWGRLKAAFAKAGLAAEDFCVILPFLDYLDYLAVTVASDIYLDSVGFSGFNMAMEAIACGLPVVTMPGRFLLGRFAFGALTQMGIAETIASTKEEYVEIAVRLGTDADWRKQTIRRMSERETSLFSDTRSVVALEEFLIGVLTSMDLK